MHESTIEIDVVNEVYGVLSSHQPKDALDVLRETKKAIRAKLKKRGEEIASSLHGPTRVVAGHDVDSHINYDTIVEVLDHLVQERKAKKQMGKNNLFEYLQT